MSSTPISAFKVLAGLAGLYAAKVAYEHHSSLLEEPTDTLHLKHMQHQLEHYREGDYKQGLTNYPWFDGLAREWRKVVIHGPFGLWDELHGISTSIGMFFKALTSEEGLFAMGCAYAVFGNKMFKPFAASGNFLWKHILEPGGKKLLDKLGHGLTWLLTTKAGLITTAAAGLFYMRFNAVYSGKQNYEFRQGHMHHATDSQAEAYGGHGC